MAFGWKKMTNFQTDSNQVSKERGASRVFLLPDDYTLNSLDEANEEETSHAARLAMALKSASTAKLKSAFADQIKQLNTEAALRVSAELTARGIAPCFRGTFDKHEWWLNLPEADFILMAADLQWIVAEYPNHEPEWERAKPVFKPRKFRKAVEYLHWEGRRTAGQIAKAMALTEQQQRECIWIQCLHVERWRGRMLKRLSLAETRIQTAIRSNDKRPTVEQDATIKRRADLWLCAELADWKPQRTANLYKRMTGEVLQRNVVAKQLDKLPRVRRIDEVLSY